MRREVEVDTALAAIYERLAKNEQALGYNKARLASLLGIKGEYVHGHRVIRETAEELAVLVRTKLDNGDIKSYETSDAEKHLAERETLLADAREMTEEMRPLNAEYVAKRWSRFFLVLNNNGHIHSSMHCPTCNRQTSEPTRFGWLPELSGLTEKDAVEAHGAILCTVCYPSAPVEWTGGISKVEQAAKDERAAAKAKRDADKAAKAITDIDGSPLKDDSGYTIRTEVTARRELSNALFNVKLGYGDKWSAYAERLAAAIAHKTGENAAELLKVGRTKAAKKYAREMS